ncbi:MAG: lipopolysaccharide biosynthesis protein [Limnohabitans sp.]
MIRSAISLGVIQVISYVVPFATLAIVGRLAPGQAISGFLFVQSLAALLSIIVDYGFHLSAVRMTGEALTAGTERQTYSTIHACKAILFAFSVLIIIGVAFFDSQMRITPDMLLGISLAAFSYGARPIWYFQAHGKYWRLIKTELAASSVSLIAVTVVALYFPQPGILAIAWAAPRFIATVALIAGIHRSHGFEWIPLQALMSTLRDSFLLFLHKSAASAVHLGVPVVTAFLLPPMDLLSFQKAERIFTAIQSLLLVVSQASYALIVKHNSESDLTRRIALRATFYQVSISFLATILVVLTAPWLMLLFWGDRNFDTTLLQLYALGFSLLAINAALGLNYLLPRKCDMVVVAAAISGAVVTMASVYIFTSLWGPQGAIFSVLSGEFCMLIVMSSSLLVGRRLTSKK